MLRVAGHLATRGAARRRLGSWAASFDAARGSSLQVRQALGAKLTDVWTLHQDDSEAEAMQAEAGAAAGTQI
eukprot:1379008-Prymnesium_polylepis.1